MQCLECGETLDRLTNQHLLSCTGITVQEYAIRHQQPLDLLLHQDQINLPDDVAAFPRVNKAIAEDARATLQGLRWAGLLQDKGEFHEIPGEIRRMDLLLWTLQQVSCYGFLFRQDYNYSNNTHRVVARNCLRVPSSNLRRANAWVEPLPDFLQALSTYVAHVAEWHAGYLFMQFPQARDAEGVRERLAQEHGIDCQVLDVNDNQTGCLLRSKTLHDGQTLMQLLQDHLQDILGAWERFHEETPQATVSKELVFDAAHFITDHPAKCSNLHGGRYVLHVEVTGRIDPVTGCVVDYGYLKRVVNRQVVNRFDHHNLNYAAEELAWRSSTEMINVHIWESLIEYLPGLSGLKLYETTQSWCDYRGPDLAQFQRQGSAALLHPFKQVKDIEQRQRLLLASHPTLRAVGDD